MNCNCIQETEERILDLLREKHDGKIDSVECAAVGFTLSCSSMGTAICIPFTVKGSVKGVATASGKNMSMVASYCPFCGADTRSQS